jgi:3-hydroxyisobutyrate dehydrogenase-like beta-hydroxyacid dehydrogenase
MGERIGFIGLGNMGQPMAHNLLKAGYEVHVYNRDASKAKPLAETGAQQKTAPQDVVEPDGIVMTMVANDAALESVTLGPQGILERLGPNGIHLSMSTVSPALAHKLAELHTQKGVTYIAAPVFGRPEAAAAQKLWIAVAGASAARERVRPLLQALGQGIFDFGEEPEKANIVKICGNFLIVAALEAMGEALTLAEKNGIDRSAFIDMISHTLFAGTIYQNYGKMIAQGRFTPVGFQMKLGLKDINLFLDSAEQVQAPMPLGNLLHDRLISGIARGKGEADCVEFTQLISEAAGIE